MRLYKQSWDDGTDNLKWVQEQTPFDLADMYRNAGVGGGPSQSGRDSGDSKQQRSQCSRSAPNGNFRLDGSVTVGSIGYQRIELRVGLQTVRVLTYAPAALGVPQGGILQAILGYPGSVTLQFSNSNRLPINILASQDVFVSRGGNPTVSPTLAVPPTARYLFVVGTNTTPPRTRVSAYGC